jgi:hypothetical protein
MARFFVIPFVSIGVVVAMSTLSISFSLGGSQVQLDLENPYLLALVSLVLGLRWRSALRFLQSARILPRSDGGGTNEQEDSPESESAETATEEKSVDKTLESR